MGTTVYLKDEDKKLIEELLDDYNSKSEVVRIALHQLKKQKRWDQLREKYSREEELTEEEEELQRQAAAELGDYPW